MKLELVQTLTKNKEKTYTYLKVVDDDGTYRADVHTWWKYQQVLEFLSKTKNVEVYINDKNDGYYVRIEEEKVNLYGGKF